MEETTLINPGVDDHGFDLPPKPQQADQAFLISNGIDHHADPIADIEMVAFQSLTYVSLRDLLPALQQPPPPPPFASPTESWREIPIKDPLLQHAAWAYLRPITTPREDSGGRGGCGGVLECFGGFFSDVVWGSIRGLFWEDENFDDHRFFQS